MAQKFLTNVELDAGLVDGSNSTGTSGYLLSSTGTATSWVDPAAVSVGESEQVHVACKNTSGVAISKGDPVYITGTVGTSFKIEIAAADASNSAKMPAVGLAETDLGINAEGFVIVSGVLKNLTTDPLSTGDGTPSSNDTVYVKVGGGLTRTKPTGSGNLIQNVGKVGRVNSANAGSLAVSTIMRTNDVPNLTTGKIWVGSPTYTTESTVVHLDEPNGFMGIGTTNPSTKLDVSGSAFIGASHSTATIGATSFACGDGNTISAFSTFAAGHLTTASGDISAAFGYDTTASGAASFSTGALTTASGGNSFAAGGGSTASGGESAAFGYQTVASGEESFAIGNGTTASGASSFAGGGPTTLASADNAFAFGADVDVTGAHSAAFGRLHDISGSENLVGGLNNVVQGSGNLVGGANNNLLYKNNNLVAGGSHTMDIAAGNYNTIIGFSNELKDGSYSLLGGYDSFNFGDNSISFGNGTTTSLGNQQYAFGTGTTTPTSVSAAYGDNQFVVGKFNIYSTGGRVHLFAVGNGFSAASRGNAFNVDTLGRVGVNQYLPTYTFDVTGTGRFTGDMYLGRYIFHNGDTNTWMGFPTNDTISFRTNSSDRMYINSSGNVGISTTSPGYTLDVSGDGNFDGNEFIVRNAPNMSGKIACYFEHTKDSIHLGDFDGVYTGSKLNIQYKNEVAEFYKMRVGVDTASPAYLLDVNGDGRVNGTFRCVSLIQTSQRDQKTEIELVGKETTSLPIKRYKYKSGDDNKLRYGVVAEDIESRYPELVETDAEGIKGVKYIDFLVRKTAELETEKRTLVNWRHYHSNTSYNMLYDTGMTTAFPYAYGSIPAPYDMYFTSFTLVNNPYSSYNKGPEGDTAIVQAYVNNTLVHEIRDIRYGNNPFESITVDFGQNVALKQGEALQIRFQANGAWRYCNSTIILTER